MNTSGFDHYAFQVTDLCTKPDETYMELALLWAKMPVEAARPYEERAMELRNYARARNRMIDLRP